MPFVERDKNGDVIAVYAREDDASRERLPPSHPDILAFLARQGVRAGDGARPGALGQSDAEMGRVLEDLVDLLVRKGLIRMNELPASARRKLTRRQDLRGTGKWMAAMIGEDKVI